MDFGLFQKITDTMMEVAGENAALLEPMEGNRELNPAGLFLQARPSTIYGGSNEIQRNILAKNVLRLPPSRASAWYTAKRAEKIMAALDEATEAP